MARLPYDIIQYILSFCGNRHSRTVRHDAQVGEACEPPEVHSVVCAFMPRGPGHLALEVGQEVLVTHKHANGWWRGRFDAADPALQQPGVFPALCVEAIGVDYDDDDDDSI